MPPYHAPTSSSGPFGPAISASAYVMMVSRTANRNGSGIHRCTIRTASARMRFTRSLYHLSDEARFAFEKSLGVERLLEAEVEDVEVMAELVRQRAQKRLPRHHARFGRRAHPHLNA